MDKPIGWKMVEPTMGWKMVEKKQDRYYKNIERHSAGSKPAVIITKVTMIEGRSR
jgi:hypothetical protein